MTMSVWSHFNREQKVFVCLCSLFVTSLVIANLTGAYLFSFTIPFALPLAGSRALLSAGIIPFPVTFILTDIINEYYGKEGARFVTLIGLAMSIFVFLLLSVGEHLPVAPETVIKTSEFLAFSGNYSGMFVASLTAYMVGQFLDIYVFGLFRHLTHGRFLWLRATGSTVISQVFDSLIVTFIAFNDNLPVAKILHIASSNYVWKFIIAVAITPILYGAHMLIKKLLNRHLKGGLTQESS